MRLFLFPEQTEIATGVLILYLQCLTHPNVSTIVIQSFRPVSKIPVVIMIQFV